MMRGIEVRGEKLRGAMFGVLAMDMLRGLKDFR